jgi:signal transduction histidine kinase
VRFSVGLRASLAVSIVALALLVSLLSIGVHAGLEVRTTIASAADRTRAWAQQVALLASRAANAGAAYMEVAIGPGLATPADAVRQDPALKSLFESALAGDPTIYDLGVFDTRGRALAHSDSSQVGKPRERRATLAVLESGSPLVQAMRLLGPPLTYDAVVPMRAGTRAFGEVRVGVSTALLREQLVDSLRVGLWVTAAALLLAILIALAFAQLLSQRVKTVAMGLERLREGEFGYRLAVEGRDELALLASSINALGERLEATRARAASGEADPDELLMATGQVTAWAKVASGLAHELADPLNAAALHLGHLKRKWKGAAPEATRHLSVLEDELKRLEQIVLGFRRFSMLGEMRAQWFDLRSLLDEVVERAREAGQDRRLEFRLEQDGTPERFWGDASLLRQALSNLIANAEQSMPGGGRVALAARRGSEGIEIRITDEGMGIPEEVQPRVFDLYFTTKEAGSGIGLAVVRQVVQLHGGRIHLRSAPGQGTEVTLQLPVRGHETGHAA